MALVCVWEGKCWYGSCGCGESVGQEEEEEEDGDVVVVVAAAGMEKDCKLTESAD